MRLHHLELSAFGPFAGTVDVDLDTLGADGLFLLHGETGAGKTTLLDAVAFALYGKVPGARGEAKRLRCDRADPATPTRVRLELTVAGRRMEITRNPEYLRPKARGTGTTTQKSSVTLRWVGNPPEGQPSTNLTRAEEVGQVVLDLLGMSADQFFQVVLLPQGEFARFLRADTAERELLLEKLFDTGRFADLEQWFADRRRAVRSELEAADAVLAQELARVCEAAGLTEEQPGGAEDDADRGAPVDATTSGAGGDRAEAVRIPEPAAADEAWLATLRQQLSEQSERAAVQADQARRERDAATAELNTGQRRDDAVVTLLALHQQRAELDAGREAHEAVVAAIAAAGRAAPVVVAHEAVLATQRAEVNAARAVSLARDAVPTAFHPELGVAGTHELDLDVALFSLTEEGAPHVPDSDATVLRGAADRIRDQAGSLGALVGLADEQQREMNEHARLAQALEAAERERAEVQAALDAGPEQRAAADAELAEMRQAAGRLADRDGAVAAATEVHRAAVSLPELQDALATAENVSRAAVDEHQRAREDRQVLIDRRIAGMAAELAGELVDGQPCVVCGSPAHPEPARATEDPVDPAGIDAAREREQRAERARQGADAAVTAARTSLTTATAAARGHDAGQARSLLDRALADRQDAQEAADRLPAVEAAARDCASRLAELADKLTEIVGRVESLRTSESSLRTSIAERSSRLSDAAAGFDSVTARRDHLLLVAEGLDAWAGAAGEHERTATALRTAVRHRDKAVADAGFADPAAALAAAELDLPRATAEVKHYEERSLVVATQLAAPDLDLDGPLVRIDLAGLHAKAEAAGATAESAAAVAHEAARRCARVAQTAERLIRARAVHEPLAEQAARLSALADVIAGRGQNAKALSLRSYVLAAKLQQVCVAAGRRLAAMSSGRYSFVHTDEREAHGKSGGLGLDILDAYSGLVRSAKTLSGGESFLASLALALGLADVVAAESGGRMLDTVFIDEGFGSLDSDTLDLVMATLDELRAGGRVVGVVSHVDEMRQRIPTRLRVRKTMQGSTVELAAC